MIKVVIADDEKRFRTYMEKVLNWEELGFQICGMASNGLQVLEMLEGIKPDIALLDINMPKLDGVALTEKLREISPETYIVFITGYSEFEYARQAVKLGVSEYLLKPFSGDELAKVVIKIKDTILKNREREKQNRKNHRIIVEELLNKLLRLDEDETEKMQEYKDKLEGLGIRMESPFYVAAVIQMESAEGKEILKEDRDIWKFGIQNILEEMSQSTGKKFLLFSSYEGNLIYVALCKNREEAETLETFMEGFCRCTEKLLRVTIKAGIGSIETEFEKCPRSAGNAFLIFRNRFNFGKKSVICYEDFQRPSSRRGEEIIEEVECYIKEHYSDSGLSAEDISEAVYLDISYIRKVFSKYKEYTIQDYITSVRMKAAMEKLNEQKLSIGEIAEACGYLDAGYFSRCFKKYYEISPRQYINQLQNNGKNRRE